MFKKVISSFIWRLGGEFTFYIVQLLTMMVLSRILTPEDFGISVSVTIIYTFFALFSDAGIKNIIIQRSGDDIIEIKKVYGFSMAMGIVITLIMMLTTKIACYIFADPKMFYAVMATSLAMIFMSSTRVTSSILEKKFEYGKTSVASITSAIFAGIIAIIMGYNGCGYWSLICLFIIKTFLEAFILSVMCNLWIPIFDFAYMKSVLKFGTFITLHNIAHYMSTAYEKMLMSHIYGTATLGIYSRAFTILNVFLQMFPAISAQILNSIYGKEYKRGQKENAAIYYGILQIVFFIGAPLMAIVGVWAEELNRLVWGAQWGEAAGILRMFAFSAIAFAQIVYGRVMFVSFFAEKKLFKFSIYHVVLIIIFTALGAYWAGLNGFIIGYIAAFWVAALTMGIILGGFILKGTLGKYAYVMSKALVITLSVAFVAWLLKSAMIDFSYAYKLLAAFVSLAIFGVAILLYFWIFERQLIFNIKNAMSPLEDIDGQAQL